MEAEREEGRESAKLFLKKEMKRNQKLKQKASTYKDQNEFSL